MQTGDYRLVESCTEISPFGNGQTTVVVVGHHVCVCGHLRTIANVSILKILPFRLVSTDCPVKTRVETSVLGFFCLEEIVKPGRGRQVGPSAKVARTEIALNGMSLCSVGTGVHWCPLVIGSLCAVIQELHLVETLCIVLVSGTLAEVVAVVVHQAPSAGSPSWDASSMHEHSNRQQHR